MLSNYVKLSGIQRESVLFGRPFVELKRGTGTVIKLACLLPDLQLFPDGDLTEVNYLGLSDALLAHSLLVCFYMPRPPGSLLTVPSLSIIGGLRNRGITVLFVTHPSTSFLELIRYTP